jgi:hypothetical protein
MTIKTAKDKKDLGTFFADWRRVVGSKVRQDSKELKSIKGDIQQL